jgi:predicted  nucleic acid-binding Zn-ribbon protein
MSKIHYCTKVGKLFTKTEFAVMDHCGECLAGRLQLSDNRIFMELTREIKARGRRTPVRFHD